MSAKVTVELPGELSRRARRLTAVGDEAGGQGRMSFTAIWPTSTPSSTTGIRSPGL